MGKIDRTLEEIQMAGMDALANALSPSEMMTFIMNWPFGRGNYTEERRQMQEDGSLDQLADEIIRKVEATRQPA